MPQANVVQSHLLERPQGLHNRRRIVKKCQGLAHCLLQDVRDRAATIPYLQYLSLEARSLTLRAGHENVREKLHLHLLEATALAGFAAPAGRIEGERAGTQTVRLGLWSGSKQPPDMIVGFDIGHRVGARRAPNRRLIDHHHRVNQVSSLDGAAGPRRADGHAPGLL